MRAGPGAAARTSASPIRPLAGLTLARSIPISAATLRALAVMTISLASDLREVGNCGFPIFRRVGDLAQHGTDVDKLAYLGLQPADRARLWSLDLDRGLGGFENEQDVALLDLLALDNPDIDDLEVVLVGVDARNFDELDHRASVSLEQLNAGGADDGRFGQDVVLPFPAGRDRVIRTGHGAEMFDVTDQGCARIPTQSPSRGNPLQLIPPGCNRAPRRARPHREMGTAVRRQSTAAEISSSSASWRAAATACSRHPP